MTKQEKFEHDLATAVHTQRLKEMTDMGALMSAVALVLLAGKTSKYELEPQEAAVTYECLRRADPSFSW